MFRIDGCLATPWPSFEEGQQAFGVLMSALGAHLSGILLARILFALAATFALVRLSTYLPARVFEKHLQQ